MFTELHKEEKREEGEVTRRRRGGIKRRETDLASNQFPKCSCTAWNTQRDSQIWVEKGRGREEIEVTWGGKGESKGERAIKPVITPLSKNVHWRLDS